MTPELREACARAVHVITAEGEVLRAGRAALFALRQVGFVWTSRLLSIPPFIWIVELGYRIIARNRPFFARLLFRRERPLPRELADAPDQQWGRAGVEGDVDTSGSKN